MQEVIDFLLKLREEMPNKQELISKAIVACAAYDPKCHYCRWHRSEEWFSGCEHEKHFEYDHMFGYFCPDFEPRRADE